MDPNQHTIQSSKSKVLHSISSDWEPNSMAYNLEAIPSQAVLLIMSASTWKPLSSLDGTSSGNNLAGWIRSRIHQNWFETESANTWTFQDSKWLKSQTFHQVLLPQALELTMARHPLIQLSCHQIVAMQSQVVAVLQLSLTSIGNVILQLPCIIDWLFTVHLSIKLLLLVATWLSQLWQFLNSCLQLQTSSLQAFRPQLSLLNLPTLESG